jgi:hypothetical protein
MLKQANTKIAREFVELCTSNGWSFPCSAEDLARLPKRDAFYMHVRAAQSLWLQACETEEDVFKADALGRTQRGKMVPQAAQSRFGSGGAAAAAAAAASATTAAVKGAGPSTAYNLKAMEKKKKGRRKVVVANISKEANDEYVDNALNAPEGLANLAQSISADPWHMLRINVRALTKAQQVCLAKGMGAEVKSISNATKHALECAIMNKVTEGLHGVTPDWSGTVGEIALLEGQLGAYVLLMLPNNAQEVPEQDTYAGYTSEGVLLEEIDKDDLRRVILVTTSYPPGSRE